MTKDELKTQIIQVLLKERSQGTIEYIAEKISALLNGWKSPEMLHEMAANKMITIKCIYKDDDCPYDPDCNPSTNCYGCGNKEGQP